MKEKNILKTSSSVHNLFKKLNIIEGCEKGIVGQLGQFDKLEFTSYDLKELLAIMK